MATLHEPKVRDLRSLYGFRLVLKKKNAEFKKVVGEHPKDEQSKLIIWNFLDPESKRFAATDKVANMDYDAMKKLIDMRFKISHGNLEHKPQSKDDPMGLALSALSRIL